jgi:ketosteroid isomerase-like protein
LRRLRILAILKISRTEEEVMDNVKTVRTIIKAFIEGDIPLLLSHVAEDVDWE